MSAPLLRRLTLFALLLVPGCSRTSTAIKEALPVQVQRTWTLRETSPLASEDAPAMIRALGLRDAVKATYEAGQPIRLRVYRMNVDASAFELIQKWHQKDGAAIYKGRYFVVAENGPVDQGTLTSFLQALQREMKER